MFQMAQSYLYKFTSLFTSMNRLWPIFQGVLLSPHHWQMKLRLPSYYEHKSLELSYQMLVIEFVLFGQVCIRAGTIVRINGNISPCRFHFR